MRAQQCNVDAAKLRLVELRRAVGMALCPVRHEMNLARCAFIADKFQGFERRKYFRVWQRQTRKFECRAVAACRANDLGGGDAHGREERQSWGRQGWEHGQSG